MIFDYWNIVNVVRKTHQASRVYGMVYVTNVWSLRYVFTKQTQYFELYRCCTRIYWVMCKRHTLLHHGCLRTQIFILDSKMNRTHSMHILWERGSHHTHNIVHALLRQFNSLDGLNLKLYFLGRDDRVQPHCVCNPISVNSIFALYHMYHFILTEEN